MVPVEAMVMTAAAGLKAVWAVAARAAAVSMAMETGVMRDRAVCLEGRLGVVMVEAATEAAIAVAASMAGEGVAGATEEGAA